MGVDLGELFPKEQCAFDDFRDRVIVIDAHNVLHQFLSSIRQRDGTPLKDAQGRITSHLSGLLYRTANLVAAKIRPVYVFDGTPHPLKARTIQQRRERKEQAEREWKEALEKGDLEKAKSKAQQTSRVTSEIIEQSKQLLEALGIPHLQAPSEGEAQASYMVKKGDAYAVGSQDFDCLLFSTPLLVRNLTSSEKRKLPNKQAYTTVHPELIRLKPGLQKLGISQEQLVDIAILIGTDFNGGVKGYGPKKSLRLLQEKGNLENALETIPDSEQKLSIDEIEAVRRIFLEPTVTQDYSLQWSKPDPSAVIHILCDEHQFSRNRIEPILENFSSLNQLTKQKNLFDF
ncbi:MAG: flap endonuclease-1 [Thermoplasmata archaeon]|nr:flap endonuclease-1 [Thermoplasmata archaeon]MBE3136233.1 flap endonuclease-1 [Thermoplasmata archaeon]MBE3140966.1 flap endonuclease-1 [Thermoplasmata archaeon]